MSERRYKVGVTTGYGGDGGPGAKWSAQAFVMDTADCYRLVGRKFESSPAWDGKTKDEAIAKVRRLAEAEAALYERGPRTVGERIYMARTATRLTRAQLADKSGLSVQTLFNWESDARTPSPEKLAQLAAVLDLSAELAA